MHKADSIILPSGFLRDPVNFLAFGLGSGCASKAPGTWGTIMAVFLFIPMQAYLSLAELSVVVVVAGLAGIYICGHASKVLGVHDHSGIVWDEFVGFWITMLAAPQGWEWILLGFLLFRLFDIWKPWPICWLDKKLQGGFGIMFDDVVAGTFAWVVLQVIAKWWLG